MKKPSLMSPRMSSSLLNCQFILRCAHYLLETKDNALFFDIKQALQLRTLAGSRCLGGSVPLDQGSPKAKMTVDPASPSCYQTTPGCRPEKRVGAHQLYNS